MPGHNRLGEAASPYLLQHASNPVHWQEWGPAAFAEARQRGVPILLSVGYATCHWCHVMAHESFEDPDIAELMNRWFVCVKVDREERPDVDRIYMDAVQTMTGRGGWPMTVFLTPGGEPFFAGTYYPPQDRPGHPSFRRVLEGVHQAWNERRSDVEEQGRRLTSSIAVLPDPAPQLPGSEFVAEAYRHIAAEFEPRFGGFGGAPKFPQAPTLEFLLRVHTESWAAQALEMVTATLRAMAGGGIRDHIGGGFARYAVDATWTVPHFEKMLYDNAQLLRLYAHTAKAADDPALAAIAAEIGRYLLTDLLLPDGAFASGEDADSEGAEGTFYVFDVSEVAAAAGPDPAPVLAALGVTPAGNFDGRNVLTRRGWTAESPQLAARLAHTLEELGEIRATRPRPLLDDKVVTAWNGLAIRALAETAIAQGDARLLAAATGAADFVLGTLRDEPGRLHRSWRQGRLGPLGFCEDYAAMALACFALYQATGDETWFGEASALGEEMVQRFADPGGEGFFATADDAESLIARPQNLFDLPTPSDNALAAEALLHLAAFTGEARWWDRLDRVLRLGAGLAARYPAGAAHHLAVLHTRLAEPLEVAIAGPEPEQLLAVVRAGYRPRVFLAVGDGSGSSRVPLLSGRVPLSPGTTAAFVCRGFVCDRPTTEPAELRAALR